MRKITFICSILSLAANAAAAAPDIMPGTRDTSMPAGKGVCYWGSGIYSPGTRMCVSASRLLVCQDGVWQVDERASPFTNDVCQMSNPRAPTVSK